MNIERKCFSEILMIMVFITILFSDVSHADDRARDRETLKGIRSVVVRVHVIEAEWRAVLEKAGLSETTLQSSIERQLQKAGIQVIAEELSSPSEFEGILNVRLNFADPEPAKKQIPSLDKNQGNIETFDIKKKYVYAVRLNLRQLAHLKRNPAAEALTITWQTESVGMRRLPLIQERIKSLIDVFIEAYASENQNLING